MKKQVLYETLSSSERKNRRDDGTTVGAYKDELKGYDTSKGRINKLKSFRAKSEARNQ